MKKDFGEAGSVSSDPVGSIKRWAKVVQSGAISAVTSNTGGSSHIEFLTPLERGEVLAFDLRRLHFPEVFLECFL